MDSQNEKISEKENNSQGQKPKTCLMAKSSLGLAVVSFLIAIGLLIIVSIPCVENLPSWFFRFIPYFILFFFISYPLSVLLGVVSIFKVKKSKGQLKGIQLAIGGIVVNLSTAATIIVTVIMFILPMYYQMECGTNLEGLGKAIMLYAGDYDDKYPAADKWCDLLIEHTDVSPSQFVCRGSDAIEGESSYAFNKYLIGKKMTEVPDDVVLLFETDFGKNPVGRDGLIGDRDYQKALGISDPNREVYKLRWNQVGGPELLTTENHKGKGCNVLFNDIHVDFVKTENLGQLKWKAEETK